MDQFASEPIRVGTNSRRNQFASEPINILFYSSFILITNVIIGLLTYNYLYSILFATLFVTSLGVHTTNYIAINLLDKLVIFLIFLYGGYRLSEKLYFVSRSLWGIAKLCIIASTCLFVIWIYCYGYMTGDLCFHPVKEIGAIYHMSMHIVGSLGHNMIMLF